MRKACAVRAVLAAMLSACGIAGAATGNITTFAGGGNGDGGLATGVRLSSPYEGAFDAAGNYYFAEEGGARVRRIDTAGIITTVAGTGESGYTGDGGNALQAKLNRPRHVAVDGAGNLYVSDISNQRVRKVDTSGTITTVAGNGAAAFAGDGGLATAASLTTPSGVAVDGAGNIYIADVGNARVRKVDTSGVITTVAGAGIQSCINAAVVPPTPLPNGDGGPATAAYLHLSGPLALDGAGGFFIGDTCNGTVRHVDSAGTITRFAGGGSTAVPTTPIDALAADLRGGASPYGLSRDSAGNLYVGSSFLVARITPGGLATRVAGNLTLGDAGDGGPAILAPIGTANGVTVNPAGGLLITEMDYERIRKVDLSGTISSFAGQSRVVSGDIGTGDGGPATAAALPRPAGLAKDAAGNVYIADQERIRRVDPSGTISTVVGGGLFGSDGVLATETVATAIGGVAVDGSGNLYYSERDRSCVRKVNGSGIVTTIAGSCIGFHGFSGDGGAATAAQLLGPDALAMDAAGNLYIADVGNKRVRKVDGAGNITTVAGSGVFGTFGDGGAATSAAVAPADIAIDAAGNLFIADAAAHRVRKVDTAGIISTVAGSGFLGGFSGDGGPATSASMQQPSGVAVDADGNVYVGDSGNNRIRMIGIDGIITTVAGTGSTSTFVDGIPATAADLFAPTRVMIAPGGALLISEQNYGRVRRIEIVDTTPDPFAFTAQSGVAPSTPLQSNAVTPTGFTGSVSINAAGGEYSIGCTGTFTAAAGTFTAGQNVCVRHTSGARNNETVSTTLSLGGRAGIFRSTTLLGPGSVALSANAFDFGAQSMRTTSLARTVTLTNTGSVDVTVNAVTAAAGFGVSHACATLAPGATCTLTITFTPTVTGPVAGSITVQASPSTQPISVQGTGERSLTVHYYHAILGREPEASGKAFWESEATRMTGLDADINETWYAMANAFFSSPEYIAFHRGDADFVADLYDTFFNRVPDAGGAAFWAGQLSQGAPREIVLVSFMLSPEFTSFTRAIFGATVARAEIDVVMDFYRGALSRLPDADGFAFWVQRLRAAQCSGSLSLSQINAEVESISSQFFGSPEYMGRGRSDGQYVGDLYNAFLRRGGDPSGVQFWIAELASGRDTRDGLRKRFLASPEFQGRVVSIINQGCLR